MLLKLTKFGLRKMSSTVKSGVKLQSITDYLEQFAPNGLAETWDNTGLLLEPQTQTAVQNVLLTNDLTEDVMDEALNLRVQLIVSYHPPIFKPLKSITTSTWKERVIGACLENKIALYSPHTSWDAIPGGVNDWLASAFDITEVTPILTNALGLDNAGGGRLCKLQGDIKISEAVERVKRLLNKPHLNLALARNTTLENKISTVGICAGSGSSVLTGVAAQLYLTGEMSHHELLDITHNGSSVILCNHSDSERGFLHAFAEKLTKEYKEASINVFVSKKDRDPIVVV